MINRYDNAAHTTLTIMGQVQIDIARERFLDLMAKPGFPDARQSAIKAVEDSLEFVSAWQAVTGEPLDPPMPALAKKTKGCKACYGSGGKHAAPCKVCAGSGRVAA